VAANLTTTAINARPFAAYTEVIEAIGDIFERRALGQHEGQRAICKYRRHAVQLFVYIGIDYGTLSQTTESTTW
jgi:hypothetical protein